MHPCEAEVVFAQAMEDGLTQEELFEFTNIDPWFLSQFAGLHQARCPLGCHNSLVRLHASVHAGNRIHDKSV